MIQHQLIDRIRKMKEVLAEYRIRREQDVDGILHAQKGENTWQPFENGAEWGLTPGEHWENFKLTCTVPQDFYGQTLLCIHTGLDGWEATGVQVVVRVNGRIEQAFDTRHMAMILQPKACPGESFEVQLDAYYLTGSDYGCIHPPRMRITLADRMDDVCQLYYDIAVPHEAAGLLPEDDRDRELTLYTLSDALNLLDLRNPYSQAFHTSVAAARDWLKEHLYAPLQDREPEAVADCIGHTHIDVAWRWDLYQTRYKAVRTFATMLKLMEQYPEFKFMSSQPQLYEFVKEDEPELFERIREAVKAGRWEPEGGMWVEADCNLSGGEALVRQFLYGNEFFQKEFDRRCRILWLPDVFGYSAALPQILRKSGIDYFMTSKLSWSEFNQSPYDTFMWKGIDGSEVLTHFTPSRDFDNRGEDGKVNFYTTYNAMLSPTEIKGGWKRFQQKGVDNHYIVSYGFGDGGGGSTDWMIENARRMAAPVAGCPAVRQTFALDFFKDLEARVKDNKRLPKWTGELYLEYHRGTYTSQARNKLNNRKTEIALRDVEYWLTRAADTGLMAYPQDALRAIWWKMLTLQFHDILPGSSIHKVYTDSEEIYAEIFAGIADLKQQALQALGGQAAGDLILCNTLSSGRDDVIRFNGPEGIAKLRMADGREYPVQKVSDHYIAWVDGLKAMSDTPVWFVYGQEEPAVVRVSAEAFETPYFKGAFDENMCIRSMTDKEEKRELVKPGKALNSIVYYENRPHNYDAWDINIYYAEHSWALGKPVSVETVSVGPVAAILRVTWQISQSTVTEEITFWQNLKRVDFEATVDWKEPHGLLKAHFPLDIFYNAAQFDIQYGNVTRATHKNTSWDVARFEVCMHKWMDVSEPGYGAALLNDCKYGCSVDEESVALTMIKSATDPDPTADQCLHHFTYALYPHTGDFRQAAVPQKAYEFNIPVEALPGSGAAATEVPVSFAEVDVPNVMIESVKKALHGEGTIIRLYECYGKRTNVTLNLAKAPQTACWTSLMEDDEEAAAFDGNTLCFEVKPYEIVTLRIN